MRFTPNPRGETHPEAIVGFITDFDSPNKQAAKAYQNYYKAISDRMVQEDEVSLLGKIAEAVDKCQDTQANLYALAAAKRLGMTPEELLSRAYKQRRSCSSTGNRQR
jgi:hypothetical protein